MSGGTPTSKLNQEPNQVTLTIDGRETTVAVGATVIEAAKSIGVDIPHYCYHPGLSVAGNCRICVVELIGGRGNPFQISCNTPVAPGMEIKTNTDGVLERRANVMEFLLVNHPLDCPICDQAGECMLQVYYMQHDKQKSHVEVKKVLKEKVVSIGPRVVLDQERCILCTRCVRFLDEVTKTGELCVINRGDHSQLTNFPGREVANNYSENIVDVCPVGALTSKLFRFQARAWFLKGVDTVCPTCATGCNVRVDYYHHPVVDFNNGKAYRLVPRENHEVNGYWMCDDGRLAFKPINENRAHTPLVRREGGQDSTAVRFPEAMKQAVAWLVAIRDGSKENAIAGIASPDCTLEELYLFKVLLEDAIGSSDRSFHSWKPMGEGDDLLIHEQKHPNVRGARLLGEGVAIEAILEKCKAGKIKGLILHRSSLLDLAGSQGNRRVLVDAAFARVDKVVVISTTMDKTAAAADVVLPSVSFIEKGGTFINAKGRIQRLRKGPDSYGRSRPDLDILGDLIRGLGGEVESVEPSRVFEKLAREFPILKSVTYDEIGALGIALNDEDRATGCASADSREVASP